MIRVVTSTSAVAASSYFDSGLARADYYTDDIIGKWHGKLAEKLNLSGGVDKESFTKLIENTHPETGEKLNPRHDPNRTVGWDINFHAPKSFSIAMALGNDDRLLDAFRESVRETMADIESEIQTRVRINNQSRDRETGNIVWAEFVHLTARPIGGVPDMHTHTHAYVFNTTFDVKESRYKAAKISEAKRQMPLHQAKFHSRLAEKTKALGYEINRTQKGWEIAGIDRELIERFSRRTAEIDRVAEQRNISSDIDKDGLGALTREGKLHGLKQQELRQSWESRLDEKDRLAIRNLRSQSASNEQINAKQAIDHAIEKIYARDSVVRKTHLLAESLRYGIGQVSIDQINREYVSRNFIEAQNNGNLLVTNSEILAEELSLITRVRNGKNQHCQFVKDHQITRNFLSSEQKNAVQHILQSTDKFIAIRGGAGTGKTTMMSEAVEALKNSGYDVLPLAPSAAASRETLRENGFKNADTVAQFLHNPELQKQYNHKQSVIWVDEVGLLGVRDMSALMDKAPDARFLITGDTKQNNPVSRGDGFRLLEHHAGLRVAELTKIRRQKPAKYKEAVSDLSKGNVEAGILKLDSMGAIKEIEDHKQRYDQIASDYVAFSTAKDTPLVVSPTRAEGRVVTEAIRSKLQENGKLSDEREFIRFEPLHYESAEKREPENYSPGMMIQYHQNAKGIKRGEKLFITDIKNGEIYSGDRKIDLKTAKHFQVFGQTSISFGRGDKIRITRNGYSMDGKRHSSGTVRSVKGFDKEGNIKLDNGSTFATNEGHWAHGYCTTSYSSQSKSVKDVLIAQNSESFQAASKEQFYVSVSRGVQRVVIYTDSKQTMQESVGISTASMSALELAKKQGRSWNELIEKELNSKDWNKAASEKRIQKAANNFGKQVEQKRSEVPAKEIVEKKRESRVDNRKHIEKRKSFTSLKPFLRRIDRAKDWVNSSNVLRGIKSRISNIRSFKKRPLPLSNNLPRRPSVNKVRPVKPKPTTTIRK